MKTLAHYFKQKRPHHKNLSWTVFSYYIWWIYVYVYTYVYHEMYTYFYVFLVIFLGLKMTTSFFKSPILRFNKDYWFYLKLNPMQGNCTVQDWVISQSPEWVYRLIYVCTYVFLRETTSSYNRLFLCFRIEMNL